MDKAVQTPVIHGPARGGVRGGGGRAFGVGCRRGRRRGAHRPPPLVAGDAQFDEEAPVGALDVVAQDGGLDS